MTGRDALIELLIQDPSVTGMVGDRISAVWATEGIETPYIVVTTISRGRHHHMGGPSRLVESRIQVDMFADTRRSCDLLADAVRQALDGYTGTVSVEGESLTLQQCHLDNDLDDIEAWDEFAESPNYYRTTHDYLVVHHE